MDFKDTFDTLKDKATDLAQAGVAQSKPRLMFLFYPIFFPGARAFIFI